MGIFCCEEVGRHLRNGNQRHEHDDSNQSDAQYNGDGNKNIIVYSMKRVDILRVCANSASKETDTMAW